MRQFPRHFRRTMIQSLMGIGAILFALSFPVEQSLAAQAKRKVKIGWQAIEGIKSYDFEYADNAKLVPKIDRKRIKGSEIQLTLVPGTYYFRIRGIESGGAAGPWSEVQAFVVNPGPPEQISPKDGHVFSQRLESGEIQLKWQSAIEGSKFQLEIHDKNGELLNRPLGKSSYSWAPPTAGEYRWRVGFKFPTRTEWSKFRNFKVDTEALSGRTGFAPIPQQEAGTARESEWWIIARVAQSVVAYSADDKDSGVNASGAALVGLFSGELRWRARRGPETPWLLSGSLNFEVINRSVLGTSFVMPRGYARVFYTNGRGLWRVGPFLHFGAGEGGIFIAEESTQAKSTKVFRYSGGAGAVAVYQIAAQSYLSGLGMIRLDLAGTSPILPGPLLPSIGFEAGFGIVLALSGGISLEGRLRAQQEEYRWQSALSAETSNQTDLFLIIDVGIGIKL